MSNYITEYPSIEELTKEQIININESIIKIIQNKHSKIVNDKNEFEKKLMEKNKNIENEINEKKNLIENIGKEENIKKEEIEFLKYDKLLEIKKLENNIKENQFIVDLLNYHYNKIIYSSKANFIIDVCFGLRNFL